MLPWVGLTSHDGSGWRRRPTKTIRCGNLGQNLQRTSAHNSHLRLMQVGKNGSHAANRLLLGIPPSRFSPPEGKTTLRRPKYPVVGHPASGVDVTRSRPRTDDPLEYVISSRVPPGTLGKKVIISSVYIHLWSSHCIKPLDDTRVQIAGRALSDFSILAVDHHARYRPSFTDLTIRTPQNVFPATTATLPCSIDTRVGHMDQTHGSS